MSEQSDMSATTYDEQRPRGLKVTHLVVGLVYLGIVASWALGENGTIGWSHAAYVFPSVLVIAGLLGLVAALAGRRPHTPSTRLDTDTDDSDDTDDTDDSLEIR